MKRLSSLILTENLILWYALRRQHACPDSFLKPEVIYLYSGRSCGRSSPRRFGSRSGSKRLALRETKVINTENNSLLGSAAGNDAIRCSSCSMLVIPSDNGNIPECPYCGKSSIGNRDRRSEWVCSICSMLNCTRDVKEEDQKVSCFACGARRTPDETFQPKIETSSATTNKADDTLCLDKTLSSNNSNSEESDNAVVEVKSGSYWTSLLPFVSAELFVLAPLLSAKPNSEAQCIKDLLSVSSCDVLCSLMDAFEGKTTDLFPHSNGSPPANVKESLKFILQRIRNALSMPAHSSEESKLPFSFSLNGWHTKKGGYAHSFSYELSAAQAQLALVDLEEYEAPLLELAFEQRRFCTFAADINKAYANRLIFRDKLFKLRQQVRSGEISKKDATALYKKFTDERRLANAENGQIYSLPAPCNFAESACDEAIHSRARIFDELKRNVDAFDAASKFLRYNSLYARVMVSCFDILRGVRGVLKWYLKTRSGAEALVSGDAVTSGDELAPALCSDQSYLVIAGESFQQGTGNTLLCDREDALLLSSCPFSFHKTFYPTTTDLSGGCSVLVPQLLIQRGRTDGVRPPAAASSSEATAFTTRLHEAMHSKTSAGTEFSPAIRHIRPRRLIPFSALGKTGVSAQNILLPPDAAAVSDEQRGELPVGPLFASEGLTPSFCNLINDSITERINRELNREENPEEKLSARWNAIVPRHLPYHPRTLLEPSFRLSSEEWVHRGIEEEFVVQESGMQIVSEEKNVLITRYPRTQTTLPFESVAAIANGTVTSLTPSPYISNEHTPESFAAGPNFSDSDGLAVHYTHNCPSCHFLNTDEFALVRDGVEISSEAISQDAELELDEASAGWFSNNSNMLSVYRGRLPSCYACGLPYRVALNQKHAPPSPPRVPVGASPDLSPPFSSARLLRKAEERAIRRANSTQERRHNKSEGANNTFQEEKITCIVDKQEDFFSSMTGWESSNKLDELLYASDASWSKSEPPKKIQKSSDTSRTASDDGSEPDKHKVRLERVAVPLRTTRPHSSKKKIFKRPRLISELTDDAAPWWAQSHASKDTAELLNKIKREEAEMISTGEKVRKQGEEVAKKLRYLDTQRSDVARQIAENRMNVGLNGISLLKASINLKKEKPRTRLGFYLFDLALQPGASGIVKREKQMILPHALQEKSSKLDEGNENN